MFLSELGLAPFQSRFHIIGGLTIRGLYLVLVGWVFRSAISKKGWTARTDPDLPRQPGRLGGSPQAS